MDLPEPDLATVPMTAVLQALGDEARLTIVRTLAREGERACGSFDLGLAKATRSHHFKVLREAGVTHTRVEGNTRHVTLRRGDLDRHFPGLLGAVLTEPATVR